MESCASTSETPDKLAFEKMPPERSNEARFWPWRSHSRRSRRESRAAFAWPIEEEEGRQRLGFLRSMGGSFIEPAEGVGVG